jgi:hypothetical protein
MKEGREGERDTHRETDEERVTVGDYEGGRERRESERASES